MAARIVKVEPFDLVVFGGTGDLAYRKLYPALFHRERSDQFTEPTRIIGVSAVISTATRSARVKDALDAIRRGETKPAPRSSDFCPPRLRGGGRDRRRRMEDLKALLGADDRIRAFYLATGPDLFGPIAKRLGAEGLATPRSRIIVEKPIGRDGESADAINTRIGSVFLERKIFRIDHYLGKESVQNLMALRFANACSSRCGTARTSITCRSRSPRRSASRGAAATTKNPARSATWCRTT